MDGRHACHANTLQEVINNRLHDYRYGKSNMLTAVKDIWFPHFNRITAAVAENCRECIAKDNSFRPVCTRGDLYKFPEPGESNESLQLNFWWPISFLTNHSDKTSKFLKPYMTNQGVPKKFQVHQGANSMTKGVSSCCNSKDVELLQ